MPLLTQPLRNEHQELLPHIERLRLVADAVGATAVDTLRRQVDDAHGFLTHHLLPHAQAEDAALYPVVAKFLGAPSATATMSRDHVEVAALTEQLTALRTRLTGSDLDAATARDLRRVLYGLYALVKVHFAKEEEIYLPFLDARLTTAEAEAMFAAMERAAAEAKVH